MDAFTTDPLQASAHIRALSERVRSFDRALTLGPAAPDPFRGQTTIGKTWREQILVSRDFEPIRGALLGFVDYLLERRLNLAVSLEESALLTQVEHPPSAPFNLPGTLTERRLLALAASAEPERKDEARSAWHVQRARVAPVSAVRVLRYERRSEIEGRLGARLTPLVSFVGEAGGVSELGRQVLFATRDSAKTLLRPGWSGLIQGATGLPALDGWPARLGADSLLSLAGGTWLVRGGMPSRTEFPRRVCPASFLRGTLQLGQQVFRAGTPESVPFVIARTPAELQGRAFGRLLALWLLSPAGARRRLGLGPEGRSRHARGAACLLVAESRLLAARALLAEAGQHSRTALEERWSELGLELCGEGLGAPLGLLSAPPEATVDLVAHAWALSMHAALVETFDEDYLDNPRAREALLATIHAPEAPHPPYPELEAACLGLARTLEAQNG